MLKHLNNNGFTLMTVIVAIGLMGILAVVGMNVFKMGADEQVKLASMSDYRELEGMLFLNLGNSRHCSASLKNVSFKGSSIKNNPVSFELWSIDQAGARFQLLLSSTDPAKKKMGKLVIEKLEFSLPDYTGVGDFPAGLGQVFEGEILVTGDKKISIKSARDFNAIKLPIRLTFDTDASGVSVITGCAAMPNTYQISTNDKKWVTINAALVAEAGDKLMVDTSVASVTVTLPSSPEVGDEIQFADYKGTFEAHNLILNRSGNKILGKADNVQVDISDFALGLVYTGATHGWGIL